MKYDIRTNVYARVVTNKSSTRRKDGTFIYIYVHYEKPLVCKIQYVYFAVTNFFSFFLLLLLLSSWCNEYTKTLPNRLK